MATHVGSKKRLMILSRLNDYAFLSSDNKILGKYHTEMTASKNEGKANELYTL